jgi:phage host-nuclease inhibitor protein Gam
MAENLPAPEIGSGATASGVSVVETVAPGAEQSFDADLVPEGRAVSWFPRTLADVEWALERLGEASANLAEIERQRKAAHDAIDTRADLIARKPERRAEWFDSLVVTWAKEHRDEVVRGKSKSRELLAGTVAFRAKGEKVVVTDEAAFIEWALKESPGLVRTKYEPDMKALTAFVKAFGEIPVGVDVQAATETITVTAHPLPTLTEKVSP